MNSPLWQPKIFEKLPVNATVEATVTLACFAVNRFELKTDCTYVEQAGMKTLICQRILCPLYRYIKAQTYNYNIQP
jgi:hypothetical protein